MVLIFSFCFTQILAQNEVLTNVEIVQMTKAGLNKEIIIEKIKSSVGQFDTSAKALIELKKENVDDEVIKLLLETNKLVREKVIKDSVQAQALVERQNYSNQKTAFSPLEALLNARTISLKKSSLQPSLPALEKELMKRPEWKDFNLTITADQSSTDLYIQVNFVHLSIITHRYTFRIYEANSGTVIAAGETTSWGSLAENLAKKIVKSLNNLKNPVTKQ